MKKKTAVDELLSCRIHTRITKGKYDELSKLLEQTRGVQTLSELLRHILNSKPIAIEKYDTSLDKFMHELSLIRKELHAIGININQVTREIHRSELPATKLHHAEEIAKLYQTTDLKVTELFTLISKFSQRWLPE